MIVDDHADSVRILIVDDDPLVRPRPDTPQRMLVSQHKVMSEVLSAGPRTCTILNHALGMEQEVFPRCGPYPQTVGLPSSPHAQR